MGQIAKVFMTGRSQAVRLPAEFRFDTAESGQACPSVPILGRCVPQLIKNFVHLSQCRDEKLVNLKTHSWIV